MCGLQPGKSVSRGPPKTKINKEVSTVTKYRVSKKNKEATERGPFTPL
jgi:hypothetical protein